MKSVKITQADHLHDYVLKITFDDGKVQEVDFKPFLEHAQHPEISKYLNLNIFKKYELIEGDLIWNDYDLVLPIWDLYTNSLMPSKPSERAS
jgi:hypothetical protein